MTRHGESAFIHATTNGPWSESATPETGHAAPRDRERAQQRSSQESQPLKGDRREERERERSPGKPPNPREGDRRSPPGGLEESTGEGSASTMDSCEHDDPTTSTPGREEAAESLAPAEAEAPPLPPNGGRGEGKPRKNPHGGHPPQPPNSHAPQKEEGVAEGQRRASGCQRS